MQDGKILRFGKQGLRIFQKRTLHGKACFDRGRRCGRYRLRGFCTARRENRCKQECRKHSGFFTHEIIS